MNANSKSKYKNINKQSKTNAYTIKLTSKIKQLQIKANILPTLES